MITLKTKRKILIITGGLPVPAVKGGAIQTLVENLIEINEHEHELDLYVTSVFDENAYCKSKKYNN